MQIKGKEEKVVQYTHFRHCRVKRAMFSPLAPGCSPQPQTNRSERAVRFRLLLLPAWALVWGQVLDLQAKELSALSISLPYSWLCFIFFSVPACMPRRNGEIALRAHLGITSW